MTDTNSESVDLSTLKIDREKRTGPPGRWKRWLHLLWILVPVVIYFAYQLTLTEITPSTKINTTRVELLTGTEAAAELVATGYVVAQIKAAVASKATGRLEVLNVEEGDQVLQGDVVGILENEDIKANLRLARANLKAARAESTMAAQNYFRQRELLKSGSSTEDVLEAATAAYYGAAAGVEARIALVRVAEVGYENTFIRAPFDGTVLRKHADVGEMVAPFASASSARGAVVTLADMSSLEVEADVSESNIQKVKPGAPCEIILDAYPTSKYAGYVKKIVPTADRSRATVLTKIAFRQIDERVLPEMSARVNFLPVRPDSLPQEGKPVLVVRKNALTMREGKQVVFRVVDGRALLTEVEVGRQLGDVTEIISGLREGEEVILSPAGGLESGDKVELSY
ncbi:MAG: efflux RND transporter periplasmic adaptor subunit [candidate division Zixibacteria bacterium]|nr:efflux RND transporter periplasmic adaptor subunit [candidate division Zixibacteria bacterium]